MTALTFEDLISPLSPAEFREQHSVRAVHLTGESGRFSKLVTFDTLNAVLGAMHHPSPHVRAIKDNLYLQYETVDDLVRHLSAGATLIVNKLHVQIPGVRAIMNVIGTFNDANAEVNLYLSQTGVGGFSVHYDTHDVYILQVSGRKNWRIFEPSVPHPLFEMKEHDRVPPNVVPYLEPTLQAGDLLYIPRGHWHDAFARDEISIHLTIGVSNPTGIDFANWLAGELTDVELWRMPIGFAPDHRYAELVKQLGSILLDATLMQRFLEQHRTKILRHTPLALPFQLESKHSSPLPEDGMVRKRAIISRYKATDSSVELSFQGKMLSVDKLAAAFLEATETGRAIPLDHGSELSFGLERYQFEKLIRHLVAEGYLSITKSPFH